MPGLIFLGGPNVPRPVGAVTSVLNPKTSGASELNWSFEQQGGWLLLNRKYTNTLQIITSSPYVGPIQIQQFLIGLGCFHGASYRFPIIEYGGGADASTASPTETDSGSFAQSIALTRDSDDARQWTAKISYSSYDINHELGNSQVSMGSANPLEMKPKAHWGTAKYEKVLWLDVNGDPILNTAGDPLEGGLKVEESRQTLTFTRNESQYNPQYAQTYKDTVNSDNFLGWSPNQVKCKDIQGTQQYTADYGYFWEVSYEFEFRIGTTTVDVETTAGQFGQPVNTVVNTSGWNFESISQGFRQKVSGMGDPVPIVINGQQITSPVYLQADGSYDPSPSADPYLLYFQGYPSQAFANLNIPQDILTASQ